MPKYLTNWVDYRLETGQEFSVAVCGYAGKVRHMYLGADPLRRMLVRHVTLENGFCQTGDHCLAMDCAFNRSNPEHLLHMLDMNEDEILDPETAEQWGTNSTLNSFLAFVQKINKLLPENLKKTQEPVDE